MKRSAFTMIELIFVIVILGILAAVAIPKLSATRDDAKFTSYLSNTKNCIQYLGGDYTARGTDITTALIADIQSCADANFYTADTIIATTIKSVTVSNTGTKLDSLHTFGGTSVIY